jgi:predicted dehydrogenase
MDASATTYSVAIIGTGRPRNTPGFTGFGMAHPHARGYKATGQCRFVAFCDIDREKAELFNTEHADGQAAVYTDYQEMLRQTKPDIVSVCTWPHLHAPMVIAAAEAGVKAIHCEKPMAPTWGEARRMAEVCRERGVQLTFGHQRRFLESFQMARQLAKDGAIGELRRLEGACSNLLDWGTHWLDMFGFYNDESPGRWVIGQVDARRPRNVYGVPMETQAICQVQYQNGVTGLLFTGDDAAEMVGCANRLVGTEGMIELHNTEPHVRMRSKGDGQMRPVELPGGLHGGEAINRAVSDNVESLRTGKTPLLAADNAVTVTEIIYACYHSSKNRGRVDLPLTIEGHPFVEMLNDGVFPDAVESGEQTGPSGRSSHLA